MTLNIEEIARHVDCMHVDLAGGRAKGIERLTAFAVEVAKRATTRSAEPYAYEIIDRDTSAGPESKKLCYAPWIDRYQRAPREDILLALYTAPPSTDAKDAERYRQARQHAYLYGPGFTPEQFDGVVDAAIAAKGLTP